MWAFKPFARIIGIAGRLSIESRDFGDPEPGLFAETVLSLLRFTELVAAELSFVSLYWLTMFRFICLFTEFSSR
jgi:hypothetical protein